MTILDEFYSPLALLHVELQVYVMSDIFAFIVEVQHQFLVRLPWQTDFLEKWQCFTFQSADGLVLMGNRNVAFDDIAHNSIFIYVKNVEVFDPVKPSEATYQ